MSFGASGPISKKRLSEQLSASVAAGTPVAISSRQGTFEFKRITNFIEPEGKDPTQTWTIEGELTGSKRPAVFEATAVVRITLSFVWNDRIAIFTAGEEK